MRSALNAASQQAFTARTVLLMACKAHPMAASPLPTLPAGMTAAMVAKYRPAMPIMTLVRALHAVPCCCLLCTTGHAPVACCKCCCACCRCLLLPVCCAC